MIANGRPLAAETIVVEPGAPRYFHVAARQRADGRGAGGDDNEIDVEPILLEEPGVFGDPERYSTASDRCIGDIESFELLG